jgi:hypothetical protein
MPPHVRDSHPPLIDVFIIHWNAPEWCVDAARSVLASEDVHVRCHVIDNGGGEVLASTLGESVDIIHTGTNRGYTGAANDALGLALRANPPAEFVVIAAHDATVEVNALSILTEVARAAPKIGIAAPILTAPAIEAGGWWRGWRAKAVSSWDPSLSFVERDWVSGTLLFIRPGCVREIGGFDETLGSYVEDVDLCLRARDGGWRVGVAPGANAAGRGSASTDVTLMVDVNSVLLAAKRRGIGAVPSILARYAYWVVRGVLAACAPRRSRQRRRASLTHARDHARAIAHVVTRWRTVATIARDKNTRVPRFDS